MGNTGERDEIMVKDSLKDCKEEYPGCYAQITGRRSAVIVREDGRCQPVVLRRRIEDRPCLDWVRLANWLIPAVIWMTAMLMGMALVGMAAVGWL